MEIKVLSAEDVQFKEKDIQRTFERDLSKLEEGLELVHSEVTIGTGRIDTLAFDVNSNQPVFIEYKGRGEFNKDALVQLMDYLSWFARDENRMAMLERLIRQYRPSTAEFEPFIRVICVVTDIDDRVRNAVYVISNNVKVFSYLVAKDTANNIVLVPKLEVDNTEVEAQIPQATSEAEILERHAHLVPAFEKVRAALKEGGAEEYPVRGGFRYRRDRVFATVRFRKKYLFLDMRVGKGRISDPKFVYWRNGASNSGYTYVYPGTEIPAKVYQWIDFAKSFTTPDEDDDESESDGQDESN